MRRPARNPLIPVHEIDREAFGALIRRVCECSDRTVSRIMDAYPAGSGLANATQADLRSFGATKRQAATLQGAFDLAHRVHEYEFRYKTPVRQPVDVIGYVRAHLPSLEQESFVVIFLDVKQKIVEMRESSRGTVASVDVHPREVFRDAIRLRAHSIIVAHNHPSGEPDPSDADVQLTNRLLETGKLVGIPVLDHLIIGGDSAVSMAQLGFPGYGAGHF